jgi:hypothetical protein
MPASGLDPISFPCQAAQIAGSSTRRYSRFLFYAKH